MEHKFKVGDTVRITQDKEIGDGNLSEHGKGYEFVIAEFFDEYAREHAGKATGVDVRLLELVTTKKPQPPKFILQYDRDTDPFEVFSTEKALRTRIAELAADPAVKRDSLKVYDIKRTRAVTLGVKITIK